MACLPKMNMLAASLQPPNTPTAMVENAGDRIVTVRKFKMSVYPPDHQDIRQQVQSAQRKVLIDVQPVSVKASGLRRKKIEQLSTEKTLVHVLRDGLLALP